MIQFLQIENYKSIEKLQLDLGRVNVLIGENGAGKSNVLEALTLASAAAGDKLDNEFLTSRGVRVSSPESMRSGFDASMSCSPITIIVRRQGGLDFRYDLTNDNRPFSVWKSDVSCTPLRTISLSKSADKRDLSPLSAIVAKLDSEDDRRALVAQITKQISDQVGAALNSADLQSRENPLNVTVKLELEAEQDLFQHEGMNDYRDFLIYSPENSAMRSMDREGHIEPLGIDGSGLFRFLEVLSASDDQAPAEAIKSFLRLFDWFDDYEIFGRGPGLHVRLFDQFLDRSASYIDYRSSNEGFLFVAFYASLLVSDLTPKFFAIDNLDTALNPKLCSELVRRIAEVARDNDKQVVLTTHNPAVLDGLDLNDPEQRLFVVSRDSDGRTKVRRFERKPSFSEPRRLSELFISGALGGIPKGF